MDMNNHSCSSKRLVSKTGVQALTKPNAFNSNVLPQHFSIEYTADFNRSFCQHPLALPPSSIRIQMWRELIGDKLWEDSKKKNECAYKEEVAKYKQALAKIEGDNKRIEFENAVRRLRYLSELSAYREALALHQRLTSDFATESRKLTARVNREMLGQSNALQQTIQHAYLEAHRAMLKSGEAISFLIIICIFFYVFPILPLYCGIIGAIIYKCYVRLIAKREMLVRAILDESVYEMHWDAEWSYRNDHCLPSDVTLPIRFSQTRLNDNKSNEGWKYCGQATYFSPTLEVAIWDKQAFIVSLIPFTSPLVVLFIALSFVADFFRPPLCSSHSAAAELELHEKAKHLMQRLLQEENSKAILSGDSSRPVEPCEPAYLTRIANPSMPTLIETAYPTIPQECFETVESNPSLEVLKGAKLSTRELNSIFARTLVFNNGNLYPYIMFGGVPITHRDGQAANFTFVGQQGSGKTTLIEHLMSFTLPLSKMQIHAINQRKAGDKMYTPKSPHEWSRSQTYQAVVYNSKSEMVPILVAFGFEIGSDLFILDPLDSRCYAVDLANDVSSRKRISQFAECLVLQPKATKNGENSFWQEQARQLIEAIIVSLRNAARKVDKPQSWTMRDLVNSVETEEILRSVLKHHDRPNAMISQFLNLAGAQKSSNIVTAMNYVSKFATIAQLWEVAASHGRKISLKDWAMNCPQSVLVLPDTEEDVPLYEPLNRALFKSLCNLFLTHEYSTYIDANGEKRSRKRFLIFDELGSSGELPDIDRSMRVGRGFGVNTVIGVQQLSLLKKTFGEDVMEVILGQSGSVAILKQKDTRTQEWASKYLGEQLIAYPKEAFAKGVSEGTSLSQSQSETVSHSDNKGTAIAQGASTNVSSSRGKSAQVNHGKGVTSSGSSTSEQASEGSGKSEQTTKSSGSQDSVAHGSGTTSSTNTNMSETTTQSIDLKREPAFYPVHFAEFPDPQTTGRIAAIYISPSMPPWEAEHTFDELSPKFDNPEAINTVPAVLPWENLEELSRTTSWNLGDYARLGIEVPESVMEIFANEEFIEPGDVFDGQIYNSSIEEEPRLLPNDFDFDCY
jgi:hypothetical protein